MCSRIISSLQKCLFEISTTYIEKVENCNFGEVLIKT